MSEKSEVLFYHLEQQTLDRVLPGLLEKTLQRGWRAVVQTGSKERLEALDTMLWTYRDDSFLAQPDYESHVRLVFLFDGNDEEARAHARQQWSAAKAAGCKVSYWKQSPDGQWENKA